MIIITKMAAPILSPDSFSATNFPVKSKQKAADIDGIHTEVVCNKFEDRVFIIVTQYMKIGTIVEISPEITLDDSVQTAPTYRTKVLLGKDEFQPSSHCQLFAPILNCIPKSREPLTHVVSKNLTPTTIINKPVLLAFALKDSSVKMVKSIRTLIEECKVW